MQAMRSTLAMVAAAMRGAVAPWWIIGSAAVALHGVAGLDVGDVDVVLGEEDAARLLPPIGVVAAAGQGTALFRSRVFARWTAPPLTVEFMAGFDHHTDGVWRPVRPRTREAVAVDGHMLFVPSRAELAALLRAFARAKDLARADLLDAMA